MEDRLYNRNEVEQIRGEAFIKGIDYGLQIQNDGDNFSIPKDAFYQIMNCVGSKRTEHDIMIAKMNAQSV